MDMTRVTLHVNIQGGASKHPATTQKYGVFAALKLRLTWRTRLFLPQEQAKDLRALCLNVYYRLIGRRGHEARLMAAKPCRRLPSFARSPRPRFRPH